MLLLLSGGEATRWEAGGRRALVGAGERDNAEYALGLSARKLGAMLCWKQAAGSRQQAAGSRQQAAGSKQQAAGSRQQHAHLGHDPLGARLTHAVQQDRSTRARSRRVTRAARPVVRRSRNACVKNLVHVPACRNLRGRIQSHATAQRQGAAAATWRSRGVSRGCGIQDSELVDAKGLIARATYPEGSTCQAPIFSPSPVRICRLRACGRPARCGWPQSRRPKPA